MKNSFLNDGERLDDLLFNGLKIIQDPKKYCFTSDAVLLANFIKGNSSDNLCDLCSGSGIVGILAQAKTGVKSLCLVEIQKSLSDMCNRSVLLNNLQNVEVVNCSVQEAPKYLGQEKFSIVCCNPPSRKPNAHFLSQKPEIDMCKFETSLSLLELVESASKLLKFGGKFYFIHDASRIAEIIYTLKKFNLEPKKVEFVFPSGKQSNVVLIEAKKGAKSGCIITKKEV